MLHKTYCAIDCTKKPSMMFARLLILLHNQYGNLSINGHGMLKVLKYLQIKVHFAHRETPIKWSSAPTVITKNFATD